MRITSRYPSFTFASGAIFLKPPTEVVLAIKKSNLIGVIVSDIGSNYVAQILRGVEEIGRMYNYDIILSSSYGDGQIEVKFAKLLLQKQVEGIFLRPSR